MLKWKSSIVLISITIAFNTISFGQNFQWYATKAFEQNTDTLNLEFSSNAKKVHLDTLIVKLLAVNNWRVQDLFILDSLIFELTPSLRPIQEATIQFIRGKANFYIDEKETDTSLAQSFDLFSKLNDKIGMIYSLGYILDKTNKNTDDWKNDTGNIRTLNFLEKLSVEVDFMPAKLIYLEAKLTFDASLGKYISPTEVDNLIARYNPNNEKIQFWDVFLANLTVNLVKIKELKSALTLAQASLDYAKKIKSDTILFFDNLGYIYAELGMPDSALHFLKLAVYSLPKEINTLFMLNRRSNLYYNVAATFSDLAQFDSAAVYFKKTVYYQSLVTNFIVDQERTLYNKKLQNKILVLQINEAENELKKTRFLALLLIFGSGLLVLVICLLFFLFKTKQRIAKEYKDFAAKREMLLQVIGHDLGGVVHIVSKYSSFFVEKLPDDPKSDKRVLTQSLKQVMESINATLENLIFWGKNISGKRELQKRWVRVEDVLNNSISIFNILIVSKNIQIDIEKKGINQFLTDEAFLGIIFRNLIYNAIKHSPNDTAIKIELQLNSDKLDFRIKNNAIFNDIERLKSIFYALEKHKAIALNAESGLGFELVSMALKKLRAKITSEFYSEPLQVEIRISILGTSAS